MIRATRLGLRAQENIKKAQRQRLTAPSAPRILPPPPRNVALTPCGASQRSELSERTRSHRNHCMKTGPGCTTHLHSFRRSHWPTCSNLGQVLVWELRLSESAEVLESVQPLSALELALALAPVWAPRSELELAVDQRGQLAPGTGPSRRDSQEGCNAPRPCMCIHCRNPNTA